MSKNNGNPETVNSGIKPLDGLLQGMRLGDNVVWQVDELDDYSYFSESFANQSISDGLKCIYVRFAEHPPILKPRSGLSVIKVDPTQGFDFFSAAIHQIIEKNGESVAYVFDNLSSLVDTWATDELLANFFQLTCPYLFELNTITYFALTRNQHAPGAVARIRDTTQILLDVFHVGNQVYIHPLKVWDRYSSQMFLPHVFSGNQLVPVFSSGDAAAISASAKKPVRTISGSIAPWESVYSKLLQSRGNSADAVEAGRELTALRQELIRMLFGNHPKFSVLCDKYLTVDDLVKVRDRLIGSGQIGGKAAGMLVARKVLLQEKGALDYSQILEEHDSFFIGSDVFFTFLVNNNLFRLRLHLSRNSQISRDEFEDVQRHFLLGQFPSDIIAQFKDMLDYFGQAPIIVRSSSLQEDNYGNAFAGKYRSEFCANQGNPEERLEDFLKAVKLVYASALNPDALAYRKKRGLGESDEQMAILVQRVSGIPYRNYFFPTLAGVAFSRNLYAWTNRIDPTKGMIRLVFGLGTRAVNRVGSDYPRMVAVSHPGLRPEVGTKIVKYSQKNVDLLDLGSNGFTTRPLTEVLAYTDYPNLDLLASTLTDGYIQDPLYSPVTASPSDLILTFNNLIRQTPLVTIFENILAQLEKAWGQSVDIEFTALIEKNRTIRVNLLQCRPLRIPNTAGPMIKFPHPMDKSSILFQSDRSLSAGAIDNIKYIIYVDPWKYASIPSTDIKKSVGRVVGKLNEILRDSNDSVMAIGPGRWGSNNIDLGVNISYADIDCIKVLVEISQTEAGHEPDLSYGTHFFQDLIEAEIIYLPVFPELPSARFNRRFFQKSPNNLSNLLPEFAEFADYISLIDVPSACGGSNAHVIADSQTRKSICFIK
jgi:pyruvate, water dikinase